jgi:hypothetical protein
MGVGPASLCCLYMGWVGLGCGWGLRTIQEGNELFGVYGPRSRV